MMTMKRYMAATISSKAKITSFKKTNGRKSREEKSRVAPKFGLSDVLAPEVILQNAADYFDLAESDATKSIQMGPNYGLFDVKEDALLLQDVADDFDFAESASFLLSTVKAPAALLQEVDDCILINSMIYRTKNSVFQNSLTKISWKKKKVQVRAIRIFRFRFQRTSSALKNKALKASYLQKNKRKSYVKMLKLKTMGSIESIMALKPTYALRYYNPTIYEYKTTEKETRSKRRLYDKCRLARFVTDDSNKTAMKKKKIQGRVNRIPRYRRALEAKKYRYMVNIIFKRNGSAVEDEAFESMLYLMKRKPILLYINSLGNIGRKV